MEALGTLRVGIIFAGMSMELDDNCATIAEKLHDMDHSAVANQTLTPTAA